MYEIQNTKGVSIVLGTYNRYHFLKKTIESIRNELENVDFSWEIIVVDGGSSDGTLSWLVKQKDIISIIQHNHGTWNKKPIVRRSWGYFMNLAFKSASKHITCMVSDDCLIIPGAIKNGYSFFQSELKQGNGIGGIAFYWRNWPEQLEYGVGTILGDKYNINHGMYLSEALKKVEWIDEEFFFYYADGDLSLKLDNAGYKIIPCPNSFIEHYSHANNIVRRSNHENEKKDWSRYLNKWKGKYIEENTDYFGQWKTIKFVDTTNTSNNFPRIQVFINMFQNKLVKIKLVRLFSQVVKKLWKKEK